MNPRMIALMFALAGCSQSGSDESVAGDRPFEVVEAHRVDLYSSSISGALMPTAKAGISISLKFGAEEQSTGLYHMTCRNGFALVKADGSDFRRELPACGSGPYFYGDQYIENPWEVACLGCDVLECDRLGTEETFPTYELPKTGERTPEGSSSPLPVIEPQSTKGPYQLTLTYHTDSNCSSPSRTTEPLTIDVQ